MKIVYCDKHWLHDTTDIQLWSFGGPVLIEEVPSRAEIIKTALLDSGFGEIQETKDFGLELIMNVHQKEYIEYLKGAYKESVSYFNKESPVFPEVFPIRLNPNRLPEHILSTKGYFTLDTYSPILEGTWEAAYWSAQSALTAANLLKSGEKAVYALCRPPGHHAASDYCAGFCYLNNAAIAAHSLQLDGRVAILDIDYHVANGTQSIFYENSNVFVCSLHGDPMVTFPYYWGYSDETGTGAGLGFHWNFPLAIGTTINQYLKALSIALEKIHSYKPDALVVSLGLDIVTGDPVGGFLVEPEEFAAIGNHIQSLNLPTLIVQEGGYLQDLLANCVTSFFEGFYEE